jgi:hypothetical protein
MAYGEYRDATGFHALNDVVGAGMDLANIRLADLEHDLTGFREPV